jgi:hypothetical protein
VSTHRLPVLRRAERSAHRPAERDFYVYFIQPFEPPKFPTNTCRTRCSSASRGWTTIIKRHLSSYAAALDLASTASGGAKAIYLSKAQDFLRAMSKWLQEKQMTAFEVTYQGKKKNLQEWAKGVSHARPGAAGCRRAHQLPRRGERHFGLVLGQHFVDLSPEYPTFSVLVTEANRKHCRQRAARLAGGTRTKDALAVLDALEMLDGDRIDPANSRYAQEVLNRLKAKGHGQVLNRSELLSGTSDVEYFAPIKFRLEPDLLVTVLGGLVYSGDIVLAITGDKIDSGKLTLLAERSLEELKQFKHVEAPKEINVAVLRALFELLDLPSGLAQKASQGKEEPVKELQKTVSELVNRLLTAGTDLQSRLSFWGQPLLRDDELTDWHQRLAALKTFLESLQPYNTVGKLKNLRVTQADIDTQKKNLEILAQVERLRDLVADLGATAAYLSQAEMMLESGHPWTQEAQATRKEILDKLAQDRTAQHAAEYRQRLATLKKDYVVAYVSSHAKARLGVSEDKTKSALRKDPRLVTLRALAAISLMPTGQLTAFEDKLDKLKSCAALIEPDLAASPVCPHCNFRPANEQRDMLPAANVLKGLDDELDALLTAWQQTLLDNLDDPITQANFDLLQAGQRDQIQGFLAKRTLPDSVTPGFISAVQEALSGLEKIIVSAEDIKQACSPAGRRRRRRSCANASSRSSASAARGRTRASYASSWSRSPLAGDPSDGREQARSYRPQSKPLGYTWALLTRQTGSSWRLICNSGHCKTPRHA